MKKNIKTSTIDYVTKKDLNNLQETLELSLNKTIEKQNKYFTNMLHEMFNKIGLKFDEQDNRFNQIDKRFDQVDKRFNRVDKRFEQVDKRFEQVDKRFEQLQKEIINNRKKIVNNRKEIKNSRSELLESNLKIIDELKTSREEQTILSYRQRENTNQLKNHNTRISTLEENYQIVT